MPYVSGGSSSAGGSAATDTIYDTKGDVAVGTGADTAAKLAAGSNGKVLTTNSATTTGLEWDTPATATTVANDTLWDAKGDLAVGSAADTAVRKAVGANESALLADSTQAGGVKWSPLRHERKRALSKPTAIVDQTLTRDLPFSAQTLLTSGTLRVGGWILLEPGDTVSTITVMSGTTGATTPTHQWFCLVRQSDLAVFGKTNDDLTTAWAGLATKTLTCATPYVPTVEELHYIGVVVVAGTTPTMHGISLGTSQATLNQTPFPGASSTTGLSVPGDLGANAAALTASGAVFYATVQ